MTLVQSRELAEFQQRVDEVVARHPVVVDNHYTRWFATGRMSADDVRHLTVQFSVFSHLFVEAQLRKVINASDIDTYRAGKEILMNELGVVFNGSAAGGGESDGAAGGGESDVADALAASEGTVDGSRYH